MLRKRRKLLAPPKAALTPDRHPRGVFGEHRMIELRMARAPKLIVNKLICDHGSPLPRTINRGLTS